MAACDLSVPGDGCNTCGRSGRDEHLAVLPEPYGGTRGCTLAWFANSNLFKAKSNDTPPHIPAQTIDFRGNCPSGPSWGEGAKTKIKSHLKYSYSMLRNTTRSTFKIEDSSRGPGRVDFMALDEGFGFEGAKRKPYMWTAAVTCFKPMHHRLYLASLKHSLQHRLPAKMLLSSASGPEIGLPGRISEPEGRS